ncbi:MAG TPA: hypothetical protein VFT21_00875, partial [Gemmatimonadaceae bacterium]|nr:hypothetical protein [Gemmatimonadaceae bacterium]
IEETSMKRIAFIAALFALTACTAKEKPAEATTSADPDKAAAGGALPAGYMARTDKPDASMSDARYSASGDEWEVNTGPAHVMYDPKVMGNGNYTASASVEQLEAPTHPEAYGIFIGGRDLDKPTEAYTYFLIRGTGDVAIKVREGDATRDVIAWAPSADVPKADASGKAKYDLSVQVANGAVKFMVNGKQVASASAAGLPTDGIAGLRINHNLHVKVKPVSITAP